MEPGEEEQVLGGVITIKRMEDGFMYCAFLTAKGGEGRMYGPTAAEALGRFVFLSGNEIVSAVKGTN